MFSLPRWLAPKESDDVVFSQEALGRFAVGDDYAKQAEYFIMKNYNNQYDSLTAFSHSLGRHNYDPYDVIAISFFLMLRMRKFGIRRFVKNHAWYEMASIRNRIDHFVLIANNQEMHDYFEAGIWDVDFIAQCIKKDIDSTLAISVHGGV